MHRPVVVFPQPLSPTSPKVSPRRTEKSIPSTALTSPTLRCVMIPSVTGKCIRSPLTSRSGWVSSAATVMPVLLVEPGGRQVPIDEMALADLKAFCRGAIGNDAVPPDDPELVRFGTHHVLFEIAHQGS